MSAADTPGHNRPAPEEAALENGPVQTGLLTPGAQRAITIAIWALFVVYVAPLLAIFLAYLWSDQFLKENVVLTAFIGFTLSENESFAILHKAILPLMGGFAPLAFRDAKATKATIPLMSLLLGAIGLSILLSAAFSAPNIGTNIYGHGLFGTLSQEEGMIRVQSFFNRTQETLSMYLLLLFGLTLASRDV